MEQYNKQYIYTGVKLYYDKHSSYKYIPAQNTIHQTDTIHSPRNTIQNPKKDIKIPIEAWYPIKQEHSPINIRIHHETFEI